MTKMTTSKTSLLTPEEAVEYAASQGIKINVFNIYYWCNAKDIGFKIGGGWKIFKVRLDAILGIHAIGVENGKKRKAEKRSNGGANTREGA